MLPVITLHSSRHVTRLVIEGELDVSVLDQLTWRLAEATALCRDRVELDASGVTFVDCCVLGRIEAARRRLRREGKALTIVATSDRFRRVSELAGYSALTAPRPEATAAVRLNGPRQTTAGIR